MPRYRFLPTTQYTEQDINPLWFDAKYKQYSDRKGNEILNDFLSEELAALKSLYEGSANAKDTALRITHPIATLPVPVLNTYSDETVALITLWFILVEALIAWPASRLPDLLALLRAIGELPSSIEIHDGEATDGEIAMEKLTWATFPYFPYAWFGDGDDEPGEIVRRLQNAGDVASIKPARRHYVFRKDIEGRLVAAGILRFGWKSVRYVARTFEVPPARNIAGDEATSSEQNWLAFQVPAVAALITHAGAELFEVVVQDGQGLQRWMSWEERLMQIQREEDDEVTKSAAEVVFHGMRTIRLERS